MYLAWRGRLGVINRVNLVGLGTTSGENQGGQDWKEMFHGVSILLKRVMRA